VHRAALIDRLRIPPQATARIEWREHRNLPEGQGNEHQECGKSIAIVGGDGRHVDLVVVFLYDLDVARKLDGLGRFEHLIELLKQLFSFAVRNCLISACVFDLFLYQYLRISEHLRLWIYLRHHQPDVGGDRLVLRKILESVPLRDRFKLRLVLGVPLGREIYALVGPNSLTGEDITAIWSEALSRAVRYGGDDLDSLEQRLKTMLPAWYVLDLRLMFSRYQTDGAVATADDIARLTALLSRAPRAPTVPLQRMPPASGRQAEWRLSSGAATASQHAIRRTRMTRDIALFLRLHICPQICRQMCDSGL
jgi:hypothetical protein